MGLLTMGVESQATADPSKIPTVRGTLKEMRQRMGSYAKNFAVIGCMFAMSECVIESVSSTENVFGICVDSGYYL